jgi:regulator of sigma E protease
VQRILDISILLNVNLAVFNLLPLPPLDGGKIVMCVLQKIFEPLRRLEIPLAIAGWVLLLSLMAYATVLDIHRIVA